MSGSTTTINGGAGGLLQDHTGNTVVQLGSNAASVVVGLGTDTILGGSGAAGVFAFNDTNNLDVVGGSGSLAVSLLFATGNATISGGNAGETVTGGLSNIKLTQAGALTLHPSNGIITIAADGQAITIWASDNSGYEVFTPTAGTTVTVAPTPDGYGHTLVTVGNSPAVALGNGFETVGSATSYLTGASASTFGNTIIPTPATPVVTGLLVGTRGFTTSTTPSFTGTAVAGDEVLLYMDGYTQIGETIANASGAWTVAASQVLSGGTHTVMAEVLDISGVSSNTSNSSTVVIDTTGPNTPAITGIDVSTDSGTVGDSITNVRHVEIDGTSDPYDTIVLYDGTSSIGSAVSNASGSWSVTSTVALTNGAHNLTAVATDPVGLTSQASSVYVVTIQTTPPLAPTNVTLDPGSDSGMVGDNLTNFTSPVIDGAALPKEIITVAADGINLGTVSTDQFGDWSFAVPTVLTPGMHVLTATATDTVGNISAATTLDLTIETTAAAPAITGAVAASSGVVTAGLLTNAGTVLVSGTAAAGTTIVVSDNLVTAPGSVIANSSGTWSEQVILSQGTNALTAKVTNDAAGNSSAASSPLMLTADLVPPATPTILGITPATDSGILGDNATDISTPTFTGTGTPGDTVTLTQIEYANGAVQGTAVVGTGIVGVNGTWFVSGSIVASPATLVATAAGLLGNTSGASAAYNLTINPVPAAPSLSLTAGSTTKSLTPTITYGENAAGTISFYDNGRAIGTISAAGTVFTPTSQLMLGLNTITAVFTDQYGDVSNPASATITVTGTATTLALDPASDSGILGDLITNVVKPQIDGTATPNAAITVLDNGGTIGTTTANASGVWALQPGTALLQGVNTLTAIASLGISGSIVSSPLVLTIETAVAAPTITNAVATTGTITSTDLTNAGTIVLTGTTQQGATIAIMDGTTTIGTVVASSTGAWADTVALTLGQNTLTAMVSRDLAGNSSAPSSALVLDALPAKPAAPSIIGLATSSDTGTLGDSRTDSTTPTLVGTGTPGDRITVTNAGTVVATGTVGSNGTWSAAITTALPVSATATLTATITDPFGTISGSSTAYDVTIDAIPAQPVIALASGIATTDSTEPQFSITSSNGLNNAVTIYDNGSLIGSLPSPQQSSTASFTPTAALPIGLNTIVAVASNAYGDVSNAGTAVVTVRPVAPTLDAGSDSGVAGDDITNVVNPQIDGVAVANAAISILDNSGSIGATTANAAGKWTFTPATAMVQGSNTLVAVVTVGAGNTVASDPLTITITTTAPAPVITGVVATTGTITSNDITNAGTVVLSGTAEQGATIAILEGSTTVGTVVSNNGSWSDPVGLVLGENTLTAAVRYDTAGNSSAASSPLVIDAISPVVAVPTISGLAPASQTGTGGTHTNLASPTLIGTGIVGDVVTLLSGTTVLGTGTVGSSGSWSVAVTTALPLGQDSITAEQTNLLGQTSAASVATTVTVSATPATPVISGISGAVASSGSVVATTANPTIVGTGPAGDLITLLNNGTILATTTAAATGSWSVQPSYNFNSGTYGLTAEATDAFGDISAQSAQLSVVVNLAKPVQIGTNLPFGIAANAAIPSEVTYYRYQQTPPTPAAGSSLGLTVDNSDLNDIITVPAATNVVSDVANGAVTLVGGGNNQLFLSTGSNATTTFESNGGSGVYLANQAAGGTSTTGNSLVTINNSAAGASGNYVVDTGSGTNVIQAITGNDSIAAGTGSDTILLGSGNDYVMNTGTDVVSCDTVTGGADTVNASADGNSIEIFANSSNLTFLGGTGGSVIIGGALPMNVLGWAGSDTVWGSSGGGQYWGGEAGNSYLEAGTGSGSCTLAGGNGNNNFLVADNAASDVLAAGGGYETLLGGSSTGGNQYFAGPGNTVIQAGLGNDVVTMDAGNTTVFAGAHTLTFADAPGIVVASSGQQTIMGGGPSEIYGFTSAAGGGSTLIVNFNPTQDQIALWNYSSSVLNAALAGQTTSGGNTTVTLPDNTRITFLGVQNVTSSSFSAS
jgi:hypothetical protein